MTVFFTSDMHFGHENIISFCDRPFDNVPHMTEMLVKNWNEEVSPDDEVFILGDACMGVRSQTVPVLGRLNGTKYLIPGNHDNVHPMYKNKLSYDESRELYSEYVEILETQILYEGWRLCHFPYKDPGQKDYQGRDFGIWEPIDDGKPLLCGHVHDSWYERTTPAGTLMSNVGIDVWDYKPIPLYYFTDQN